MVDDARADTVQSISGAEEAKSARTVTLHVELSAQQRNSFDLQVSSSPVVACTAGALPTEEDEAVATSPKNFDNPRSIGGLSIC